MTCDYYRVLYEEIVIAEKMTIETALLLVKALFEKFEKFEKFWQEPDCHYTIEKMGEVDDGSK